MCWTKEIAAKIVIKACSYIFAQKIFVLPKRLRWGRSETQWLTCPVRSVCSWLPGRSARDVLWRRGRRRSDHWPKKINRLGSALLGTLQEAGQDTGQTSGYGTPATMRAGFKESAGQPPTQHQRPTLILFIDMDQILQHHRLFFSVRLPPRRIPLCVHLNVPDYILRTSTTDINRNSLTILRYWSILHLYHFLLLASTLDSIYTPEINMRHVAFQGPEHHPFSAIAAFGSGHVTPVSGSSSGI